MSGQPALFYSYEERGAEHEIFNWYGTQAAADAGAASAGRLANVGAVEVPNGWATGWIRDPADGAWRLQDVSDLDDLGQRTYAATALYAALDGMMGNLSTVVAPSKDIGRVQDVIVFAKWAAFVVFNGTWTGAQQIAWAQSMMLGPTDGEDLKTLTRAVHGLADAVVPMGAFAWANPADAVRVTLAEAEPATVRWFTGLNRDLTMTDVDGAAWIERMS